MNLNLVLVIYPCLLSASHSLTDAFGTWLIRLWQMVSWCWSITNVVHLQLQWLSRFWGRSLVKILKLNFDQLEIWLKGVNFKFCESTQPVVPLAMFKLSNQQRRNNILLKYPRAWSFNKNYARRNSWKAKFHGIKFGQKLFNSSTRTIAEKNTYQKASPSRIMKDSQLRYWKQINW